MNSSTLTPLLVKSLAVRQDLFDASHRAGFRLFNGFTEGCPEFVADLYGSTLLLHNYAAKPREGAPRVQEALDFFFTHPLFDSWLRAAWLKTRHAGSQDERRGALLFGAKPDDRIREHGVVLGDHARLAPAMVAFRRARRLLPQRPGDGLRELPER